MKASPSVVEWLHKRSLSPVERGELQTWSTRRLLARLKKLHRCMDWIDDNDLYPEEVAQVQGRILLKNTPEWQQAWSDVKGLLAGREHVLRTLDASHVGRSPVQRSGAARLRGRK